MTLRSSIAAIVANEDLNFLLTNRLPRRLATRLVGWFSKIEQPLIARASIAIWRLFSNVDLAEAETTHFRSMHDCFVRRLKPGARAFDDSPGSIASPCDAIVGANGLVSGDLISQIKGMDYRLAELVGDATDARPFHGGRYVTLRLTAGMYHHFHAPADLTVERVRYLSGDCWNVNPIALKRVERLFCRNERAAIHVRMADGRPMMIVAVAAILVASIRFTFLDTGRALRDGGDRVIPLGTTMARGADMGWFEHGSTIVLFAPEGFDLAPGLADGQRVRAGERLLVARPGPGPWQAEGFGPWAAHGGVRSDR